MQAVRKKSSCTCQFIQHFRKQLLAGRVKNEELLQSEKRVPGKHTQGGMLAAKSPLACSAHHERG